MANETYKLMCATRQVAKLKLKPCAFASIRLPGKGKTDTKRTFLYNYRDCREITPTSDTGLGSELITLQNVPIIIVDDPSDWSKRDFESIVRYSKGLYGGETKTPRATKFNRDNVSINSHICLFWFWHKGQHSEVEPILHRTGYQERLTLIWSQHTDDTLNYIEEYYDKYNIDTRFKDQMPIFDLSDFKLLDKPRNLTTDEKLWIREVYQGSEKKQGIKSIARTVDEDSFESLKIALESNTERKMFYEDIKFIDKKYYEKK